MKEKQSILAKIKYPNDLKKCSLKELDLLATEIRELIIGTVAASGGHLAPNLGVVELTIALHYVFNCPTDKLLWDVGHQAYIHKILTGRKELFKTLRKSNGCRGFLSREESEYDCFGAGHAGTAISAALGMAAAADINNSKEKVVAIVGDGALNCGISLEGLNNIAGTTKNMIIILNDNKMSISENVGAISSYLNRIISGQKYNKVKRFLRRLLLKMPHYKKIYRVIHRLEEATKSVFLPGAFFEELGIRYLGPIDGHDLPTLLRTLSVVKEMEKPVLVHVITEKGRGYSPAVEAPEKFHGLGSFDPQTGKSAKKNVIGFSEAFGKSAIELAEKYPPVVAITAAMASGTGLSDFATKYPSRFYDVGIAEEHAVVFAAGLAASGIRPVVAIYATFMQRALDCVFHDVCLQNLPVIFCLDRAGVVEDGPTHHGIHDLAFFRSMPNLVIMAPSDEAELRDMLFAAYKLERPVVIRYPRGSSGKFNALPSNAPESLPLGKSVELIAGRDGVIWAMGAELNAAMAIAKTLRKENGIELAVVNVRFLLPFDVNKLLEYAAKMPLFTLEDCVTTGGLASEVAETLLNVKHFGVMHFGWNRDIVPHGSVQDIKRQGNMGHKQISQSILSFLSKEKKQDI